MHSRHSLSKYVRYGSPTYSRRLGKTDLFVLNVFEHKDTLQCAANKPRLKVMGKVTVSCKHPKKNCLFGLALYPSLTWSDRLQVAYEVGYRCRMQRQRKTSVPLA